MYITDFFQLRQVKGKMVLFFSHHNSDIDGRFEKQ